MNEYNVTTSYFKVAAENPCGLSICPRTPPWYVWGKAMDIMCSKELYDQYFKRMAITKEEFYKAYVEQTLSRLDPIAVLEKYRGKILVGYYKPDKFDCRTMFVRWIREETGIEIPEWQPNDLWSGILPTIWATRFCLVLCGTGLFVVFWEAMCFLLSEIFGGRVAKNAPNLLKKRKSVL